MSQSRNQLTGAARAIAKHVNLDAEASTLGGIFLRNEAITMLPDLEVDDFYNPRHQAVFAAMRNLESTAQPIDPVTVDAELVRVGKSEAIGGLGFLSELTLRVPSVENVIHYAGLVKNNRIVRDVVRTAMNLVEDIGLDSDDPMNGEDAANLGIERLQRIQVATTQRGRTMGQIIDQQYGRFLADMQAKREGRLVHPGMPTGIAVFDQRTGGIPFDVLTLLGARPSGGKTTVAGMMVDGAITIGLDEPLVFSFEDGEHSFAARRFAKASGVPTQDFIARNVNAAQEAALDEAYQRIRHSPDTLVMAAGMFVEDICRYVKSFRRRPSGLAGVSRTRGRLVVIDYLQKMRLGEEFKGQRNQALGHITRTLSWLAQEEGIAVVLLSQLSRGLEQREDPTPLMSDFKDSGDIEQDAKLMIGLHYPHHYDADRPADLLEAHVLKNNNGDTGVISLHWDRPTHTVVEHAIDVPTRRTASWSEPPPRDYRDEAPLPEEPFHR